MSLFLQRNNEEQANAHKDTRSHTHPFLFFFFVLHRSDAPMESGKGLAGIEELLRQSTALSERLTKELGKSAQFSSVSGYDNSPLPDPAAHQQPASLPSPLFNTVASNPAGACAAAAAEEVLAMPMPTPGMPTPLRGGTELPGHPQQSTLRSTPAVSCPTPASRTRHPNEAGGLLDDSELHALSGQVPEDALLEAHSGSPFGFAQYDDRGSAAAAGPAAVPPASLPSGTGQCYRGSSVAAMDADEAEVLQSKAEAIVAALDDSQGLKQTNPYGGLSFQDLIQKISLDPNMKVYAKKVPAEKLVQGTVAEQLISVVDCEKERYLYRTRTLVEDYEARLGAMQASHEEEQDRLREEFVQQREEADKNVSLMMERSKQSLKGQTEQLAREGLATHLESERTKDELALVNEDVASLKKLLFFWKKKNNVLKQQFDGNERELVLAREKLKDYHQIHEMDAYKVHRFCGQLREREMRSRWRADELEKRVRELQIETAQLKDGKSLVQPESQMFGENEYVHIVSVFFLHPKPRTGQNPEPKKPQHDVAQPPARLGTGRRSHPRRQRQPRGRRASGRQCTRAPAPRGEPLPLRALCALQAAAGARPPVRHNQPRDAAHLQLLQQGPAGAGGRDDGAERRHPPARRPGGRADGGAQPARPDRGAAARRRGPLG